MDSFARAQARYDAQEEPTTAPPYRPDAVDEAIQYVRRAKREGAPETPYELLCEATSDLAVRQRAAWFLGVPPLATTTAIQRPMFAGPVGDVLWALDTLRATLSACWRRAVDPDVQAARRAEVLAYLGGWR